MAKNQLRLKESLENKLQMESLYLTRCSASRKFIAMMFAKLINELIAARGCNFIVSN